MSGAEFDRHAEAYDGGLDNPVKRMMGNSADQFIGVKARWLLRREPGLTDGTLSVLDYGCGAGDLMRVLADLGARARFTGCDVSEGMLAEVAKRWPERTSLIKRRITPSPSSPHSPVTAIRRSRCISGERS